MVSSLIELSNVLLIAQRSAVQLDHVPHIISGGHSPSNREDSNRAKAEKTKKYMDLRPKPALAKKIFNFTYNSVSEQLLIEVSLTGYTLG